uniref:N-acetyllactosaminide alpha-1,3-galactosyltransferase n=1 Tax=Cebus imitator TaxID=2715852 RepID=A0A2K5QWW4_CEBIM
MAGPSMCSLEEGIHRQSWFCVLNLGTLPSCSYRVLSPRSLMPGRLELEARRAGGPSVLAGVRKDVLVVTPWLAPIVWEGTFNTDILNEQFRLRNTTIGLTVFAIKKYVAFVKLFLETAEKHFMVGHRVHYYVFTDQAAAVPHVALGAGRQLSVLEVRAYERWQDVSMRRMEMISDFCERRFLREVDYLVCADVDMKFSDHVGVEILSPLFGTLHPGFYGSSREAFTYERRPQSQAYIPKDEGDFYYLGGFFGGSVQEVQRLTRACHQAMMIDQANGIEAVWHDESHLNKYLLRHKPTKVLSPEYLWDQQLLGWPPILKKLSLSAAARGSGRAAGIPVSFLPLVLAELVKSASFLRPVESNRSLGPAPTSNHTPLPSPPPPPPQRHDYIHRHTHT